MKLSSETLEILAETSEEAKEVFGEWGHVYGVAFRITPDGDDLHISVVDTTFTF